ncbi:MAG: carboxylating nicotinate-nucleotide diphosphorylase [Legionellales bacterium]|nr:carboxylating nicotinate-nucleotide diphosphorylase [Legionellales bacterium]
MENLSEIIRLALQEDIGSGDISAQLIAPNKIVHAVLISRQAAIVCGIEVVKAIFSQVSAEVTLNARVSDGDFIEENQTLIELTGNARTILTLERSALNFLQLLSATATTTHYFVEKIKHTQAQLLDTRKTIPGFRALQKYAVRCGGGKNHRMGLFDAFLIKENHIRACGGITQAVKRAREIDPHKIIEVEVENLAEYHEAINSGCEIIMLDNFELNVLQEAVAIPHGVAKLEASGGVNLNTITAIAETGVDYISVGSITKHIHAVDLSLLVDLK